jgi:hypothetical protein
MAQHLVLSTALAAIVLTVGMWGYEHYEHLGWRDAFLNAAMLLGGMGPVHDTFTPQGKVFAGLYALLCGLVFVAVFGILVTPVVHRLMHRLHWPDEGS